MTTGLRRKSAVSAINNRLKDKQGMEPYDYCHKHIGYQNPQLDPDGKVTRADCIRAIVEATLGFYKFESINNNWGGERFERRPDKVLKLLEIADALSDIDAELKKAGSSVAVILERIERLRKN